jgi:hypothetical protein
MNDLELAKVERRIFLVRSQKVMLDFDLAELYGVETRALKQAVRRNLDRFPADFMFELSTPEIKNLVSQTVIPTRGKRYCDPFRFALRFRCIACRSHGYRAGYDFWSVDSADSGRRETDTGSDLNIS